MILRTLSLLLFLCLTFSIQAQVIATTEDGKKVVLKSDGTWVTLEEYTKSLTGETPAPKKKEEAAAPPPAKAITMADFECGELMSSRTNTQTQEDEMGLKEELLITEEDDPQKIKTVLRANKNKTFMWDLKIKGQQGCANETPEVIITFKDGKSIKLKVANDFLCDASLSLFLSKGLGNKNDIKALKGKPMTKIAIQTRTGMIEEDLDDRQSAILQKAFNCLGGK